MSGAQVRTSVGSLPILSGGLVESIRGNWTGTVAANSATTPAAGEPASIVFLREDGTEDTFSGVLRRVGASKGSSDLSLTIVGGKGLLLADLPPRDHAPGITEIPAGLIAKGIVDDAGELLAAGVEAAADAIAVHRWTRMAMPARDALDVLADVLGWGWRVLRDGSVWAGLETWPALDATTFLAAVPDELGATYACDGAPIRPGVTLTTPDGDRRVVEVVYSITAGASRATVRPAVPGDPPATRWSRDLYRATYAATVREQAADGALVLVPDDPRLGDDARPLRGVAFRLGIPGALVTLPVGSRVRVRLEGADPRGAYAADVDQDPAATAHLALVGDAVDVGGFSGVANLTTGIVAFTYMPVTGPAQTGVPFVNLVAKVAGPGHKYAKGVSG